MSKVSDEAVAAAVKAHNDAVLAVQGDLYDFGTIDEFMRPALEAALRQSEFDAFIAGFNASGEGFNGEYVGSRYRGVDGQESPVFLAEMRESFDLWYAEKCVLSDGNATT